LYEFKVEIAGVPLAIRSRFRENSDFFREYDTRAEALLTLEATEADLERMQADFDRFDEAGGLPKRRRSDAVLENYAIHRLLAEKLTEHHVLLMHGSALCMDGQAYIFTAKSGTGKSTHARLWREVFGPRVWMINDDKPMLKFKSDGITVWGTPWDGKHHLSRNAGIPLKAVVHLKRDDENSIEPLPKADAFPVIMEQTYHSKDPATAAKILKLEMQLLNKTEFYTLYCNQETEAARTAYKGITGLSG
jgi:hypothetical protein